MMKILLADDDPVSRRLVQMTLQNAGYDIIATANGRDALEHLQASDGPRLAIVDWNMPEMDGPSLCASAKAGADELGIYLILLTSRESTQDVVSGFGAGADDYLIKPTHPEELKARVRAGERILTLQSKLVDDARRDSLTRLANRKHFLEQLHRSARSHREPDSHFAVMFVDIDRFKSINDSVGHHAGDRLICGIADRLATCVAQRTLNQPTNDLVARIGGDEFVVLLDPISTAEDAVRVAGSFHRMLRAPFLLEGESLTTTASIGIAISTAYSGAPHDLLMDADTAMYKAKAQGPGRYKLCDVAMHHEAVERLAFESDLRRAIEFDQLRIFYQPIVSLERGELVSFEALVRWERPGFGMVSPDIFIPLAEETGLIVPIGSWVLEQACRQVHAWNERFGSSLSVAVNVSARQFARDSFPHTVRTALATSGLPPGRLSLEITESLVMADPDKVLAQLDELRSSGIGLSCDDFGTGFSSLSYLHRLPLSTLKIDRSFISRASVLPQARGIVEAIITLGHKLGMTVVAEGVEKADEVTWLKSLACDFAQGYYFAVPLSADTLTVELESGRFRLHSAEHTDACHLLAA